MPLSSTFVIIQIMIFRRVYLDYASLTPIDRRVAGTMRQYSSSKYANPSAWYKEGVRAKQAMDKARRNIADFIHAHSDEIVFTSGGTEANNMALIGVANKAKSLGIKKPHIIVSVIEHSSILNTVNLLEKQGCEITIIPVNKSGIIDLLELKKAIKENTCLISIMLVNNEIGTIQPIHEVAKILRNLKKTIISHSSRDSNHYLFPLLHTDACQGALYQEINVEKLGVDMMTLDGSKVYGPRGIGCLYMKRNTFIEPIIHGGGQEYGMRSGTENIPMIMGFAKALQIVKLEQKTEITRINQLRELFIDGLKAIKSDIKVNPYQVSSDSISPHILNVSIPGIDNEFFVLQLDAKGIACSTKSSCLRDEDQSYVLNAIQCDSKTSIRFSFGRWTKKRHIRKTICVIRKLLLR